MPTCRRHEFRVHDVRMAAAYGKARGNGEVSAVAHSRSERIPGARDRKAKTYDGGMKRGPVVAHRPRRQARKPRSWAAKLPRFGKTAASSAGGTPNQRESVAPY